MKYRVTFMERTGKAGNPPEFVEPELIDGVVLDATFIERLEPESCMARM